VVVYNNLNKGLPSFVQYVEGRSPLLRSLYFCNRWFQPPASLLLQQISLSLRALREIYPS
ncbi:MAG TPA: hypothetical protein PKV40_09205, partial [Candidatus Kapabacteria bacterium]|nr:hypothetical protein [Candidatus Kapabacteria bacterium]